MGLQWQIDYGYGFAVASLPRLKVTLPSLLIVAGFRGAERLYNKTAKVTTPQNAGLFAFRLTIVRTMAGRIATNGGAVIKIRKCQIIGLFQFRLTIWIGRVR